MSFLLFIVVLIFVIYQNKRINDLELLIKKGGVNMSPGIDNKNTNVNNVVNNSQDFAAKSSVTTANNIPNNTGSNEEFSGRLLGRIGIAAVVIGMAFFLKYAFDNNWIGPAGRVLIGILVGMFAMGIGQYLREKYLQYSDLLMGGGLAILYLSVFSSYALYNLVDPIIAFFGMIVITGIGVLFSIINATMSLSVIAFIGGYLSPMLIGVTYLGEFITFTYITILNVGMLSILLYKKWTNLIITGFIGTWLIFGTWLASSYREDMLIPTLFFILIQFLIFTASSIYRIIVEKLKANELDYIVLSVTAFSFALVCYSLLMPEYKHFVSVGSVLVAGFYILIALLAYKENPQDKTLNIFLPGLAVCFLTIAVPIEFSGPWVAAWWFMESLVLYVLASTSSSRGFQVMGVIVYILGLFKLLNYLGEYHRPSDYVVFFNGPFIMTMMSVFVAYTIAFIYYKYGSISTEIQKRGINAFVIMANVLTIHALTYQIISYYELKQVTDNINYIQYRNWSNTSVSILWALYATLLTIIGFAKKFISIRYIGLVLFIITAFKVLIDVWSLGELYRIISFIVFGIIALSASFMYVKYKDRLNNV